MREWKKAALGELIETNVLSISPKYPFAEILYLDTGSITRGKAEQLQRMSFSEAPSRAKRLVQDGDIVYSSVRPIQRHYGIIKNPPENLVVSTGFVVISCRRNKLDPNFAYYYLTQDSVVEELDIIAEASTSTYPSLKPSDIENLSVCVPLSLVEQRAIADILSSLDDKIDLLHRQNKTLESLAETLFRQWFIEEAQPDWKEYTLSDFADHIKEGVIPANSKTTTFHHYSLPAFDAGKTPTIEFGGEILSNKYKVSAETILISKLNPRFPRVWPIIKLPSDNSICSTEFQVIKPKGKLFGYIYYLLCSKDATDYLAMSASGTSGSHQRVRPEDILNITASLPSIESAEAFSKLIITHINKVHANQHQIQTLEKLRDTLLPKLMSREAAIRLN